MRVVYKNPKHNFFFPSSDAREGRKRERKNRNNKIFSDSRVIEILELTSHVLSLGKLLTYPFRGKPPSNNIIPNPRKWSFCSLPKRKKKIFRQNLKPFSSFPKRRGRKKNAILRLCKRSRKHFIIFRKYKKKYFPSLFLVQEI